jgi:hypothetical protein
MPLLRAAIGPYDGAQSPIRCIPVPGAHSDRAENAVMTTALAHFHHVELPLRDRSAVTILDAFERATRTAECAV